MIDNNQDLHQDVYNSNDFNIQSRREDVLHTSRNVINNDENNMR